MKQALAIVSIALLLFAGFWFARKMWAPKAVPMTFKLPKAPSLTLDKVIPLNGPKGHRFDTSGLTLSSDGKQLLTVNDKPNTLELYSLPLQKLTQKATKAGLSASKYLQGRYPLQKLAKAFAKKLRKRGFELDLEGVAQCNQHIFAISERLGLVFRIHSQTGATTHHSIDKNAYAQKLKKQGKSLPKFPRTYNAGYEGIACDSKRKVLYLIQERQPRLILTAQMPKTWKDGQPLHIQSHFDLPNFTFPQKVNGYTCPPDFAGASVFGGSLYLLYRNARMVLKADPVKQKLLSVYSYYQAEEKLYIRRKPYGFAEGLTVTKDKIYIVFDNNNRVRQSDKKDKRPTLLLFQRPKDF